MPHTNSIEAASDTAPSPRKEKSTSSSDPASSLERNKPMRKAHFVLQGKRGVGKTFVASLIAQYLTERGEPIACLDTDQVNGSFHDITALGVRAVKILCVKSRRFVTSGLLGNPLTPRLGLDGILSMIDIFRVEAD
jgi:Mrp family chromosome partitioning ATPase